MTNYQKVKKLLPFNFVTKTTNGFLVDGMVFIYESLEHFKIPKVDKFYPLNLKDLSNLMEILDSSLYEKVLPENYHLKNNLGKFSDSDLYFLVAENVVKIGVSTDIDSRIMDFKTSVSCEFDFYYIERKGFLEKTMHHAFSDFHKKGEWFHYNERFDKFIKENALRVNQNEKHVSPHIKSYILDFGHYKGYDIKELIDIDNKYCQSLTEYNALPDKIKRFVKCNKR